MDIEELISMVMNCAIDIRRALAPGYMEKVYENAMAYELQQLGLEVGQQVPLDVFYKGFIIGKYVADLVVDNKLVIEIKAVNNIEKTHEAQLVNYLTTTGYDNGLIINYGNPDKIQFKRKFRVYSSK